MLIKDVSTFVHLLDFWETIPWQLFLKHLYHITNMTCILNYKDGTQDLIFFFLIIQSDLEMLQFDRVLITVILQVMQHEHV